MQTSTTQTPLTNSDKVVILREARKEFAAIRKMVEDYQYDLTHPETNAFGQTLSISHCIHGASLWVDHDIPCGPCEGGESYWYYREITFSDVLADTLAAFRASKPRIRKALEELADALMTIYGFDKAQTVNVVGMSSNLSRQIQGRWMP